MAAAIPPGAGVTPAPGPRDPHPRLVAAADQQSAALRDLVQLVRDHHDAHVCVSPLPCPGEWALEQLLVMGRRRMTGLLALAPVELSALGYGMPATADAYWPTDASRAALDDEEGRRDG